MKRIVCEICGGDIQAKSGGIYVCTGCGMQYDRERIVEMAAKSQQVPEQITYTAPTEPSKIVTKNPAPHKNHGRDKLIAIIVIAVIALLALTLPLLPKNKTGSLKGSATPKTNAVSDATPKSVEHDIEGTWYYNDPEIGWHEEHYFCGGLVAGLSWLDDAPEKATNTVGEYEVLDGQIRRRSLQTDYVLYYDYYYEGDELVLSWLVDGGRDSGHTRIYRKYDESSTSQTSIPSSSSQSYTAAPADTNVTSGMRNALQKAKSYLQVMAFSRQGIIEQLEYENFSHSEAVYAADNCGADWNQQAVERAKSYLDFMSFSRARLIEQLEYDGFSYDQAVYAVDKVY